MAPCTKLGKGIPICNQSKEIIYNLFLHEDEANKKNPSSIETTFQLVAKKTGISLRSVQKIISEKRKYPDGLPEVPKAPRKCRKALSDIDKQVIQRIIRYYHATEQQFPTVKKIHEILKQEINYSAGITTLRKHIVQLGFKWKKTDDKKRLLIEKKQTDHKKNTKNLNSVPMEFSGETSLSTSHTYPPPPPPPLPVPPLPHSSSDVNIVGDTNKFNIS